MNDAENLRRLQCLFEHCAEKTMHDKLDVSKNDAGAFTSQQTSDLFKLWLSGHGQGVADYAVQRGDVKL